MLTSAEQRLTLGLRLIAALLFMAALICTFGPLDDFFREPPFVANSVVAGSILGLTCLYAAGNVHGRLDLVPIAVLPLALAVVMAGLMLAAAETGADADVWFVHTSVEGILWAAIVINGVLAIALVALWLGAGGSVSPQAAPDAGPLSQSERLLRTVLWIGAGLFAAAALAAAAAPYISTAEQFARELPFVVGSVVADATIALLCLYVAVDLRRNQPLVGPVIAVQAIAVAVQCAYLIAELVGSGHSVPLLGGEVSMSAALLVGIGLSLVVVVVLGALYRAACRARYGLSYFWPVAYRGLLAAADVLVEGADERVSPNQIAARVEEFVDAFRAKRRGLYRLAFGAIQLAPLIELRPTPRINPPLSELDRDSRRRFLTEHFQRLPDQPRLLFLKHLKQIIIRICQQLTYAGYYSNPRTFDSVGYKPFSKRPEYAKLKPVDPGPHPLEVERPVDLDNEIETEVCVVGSGAAGGILAYELAKQGKQVLVLERGRYLEPRHFNEDEIDMISALYADGLMQLTEDWRFNILQGNCVGGSTTVNNAVCFPPPPAVLERWNDPAGHDARLELSELESSVDAVEDFLKVQRQPTDRLNRSAGRFVDGAAAITPDGPDVDIVRANIEGCLGSGYCNIGCKWGKKLSMLETALPWAQRDFPGRMRIVADASVERIHTGSGEPTPVTSLEVKLGDGRLVSVRAEKYVICAGAVGSSYLLLKSGVGKGLPVGGEFSANMGAPLTAEFEKPQEAFAGLQISHYGMPRQDAGFVFETWFNPPVAQALNMPGWFEKHYDNMRCYKHLMAVGVLVGTASDGHVISARTGGPGVKFTPNENDLKTLARGLKLLGRILFKAGAKRLMINTWGDDELRSPEELDRLDRITADPDYISLGTGHPQGGNVLSNDPKRGVVGPEFRVHGHSNLYICDASVFPTSLTVNPQLTVMSLAHYAAPRIADGAAPS